MSDHDHPMYDMSDKDKQIDALLNRLHSGCRFVDFEENNKRGKIISDGDRDANIYNRLRNMSSPDETHAELGLGLAQSYVGSLQPISTSNNDASQNDNMQTTAAIERGDRIIQSLCCGLDVAKDGVQSGSRLNYSSTAHAFFDSLQSSFACLGRDDDSFREFIQKQWCRWCLRCEELVLDANDTPLESSGGGIHVLNACLKGYCHICCLGKQFSQTTSVIQSLLHHSSRKYLIRVYIVYLFKTSSNGQLVNSVILLFHSCILRACNSTRNEYRHLEREFIVREVQKACSKQLCFAITNKAMSDKNKAIIFSQHAGMLQYSSSSLASYLTQSIHASFSNVISHIDIFELGFEWLCGICDSMMSLVSTAEVGSKVADAISASIETIIAVILPQFTPSFSTRFELATIYSTLASIQRSIQLSMASPTIVLRLGSLALNLDNDLDVMSIIDLILSILSSIKHPSGNNSSSMAIIGGISTALGCIFRCRPASFDRATHLYEKGYSLLEMAQDCHEPKNRYGIHLIDIITCAMGDTEFSVLFNIITASISEAGSPFVSINRWRSRPLLFSDQCAGLLIGLSLFHISTKVPQISIQTDHALEVLRSLLEVYPRLSPRAIPSIIDGVRACIQSQSTEVTQNLLGALKFLASQCIVSDPHGAQMAWSFLSSLAKEGVPTAVRSTVIRLLPGLCSSNKRLTRRVLDGIGMSMTAHDPLIRIASTAALSDLAKLDLIRDVEPIIGLVQNRLVDDDPAVVYYALHVLRYFVMNQELEFDLVVRVLEKRLDVVLRVDTILSLDKLVLEGLIGLLGHGGLDEGDDADNEDNGEDVGGPTVTTQTLKAIELLVDLSLSPKLLLKSGIERDDEELQFRIRIHKIIYGSLARYSSVCLGLDSESIRSWDGLSLAMEDLNVRRYLCLKEIVTQGLDFGAQFCAMQYAGGNVVDTGQDLLASATTIGKTLLMFEEDVHGSFLFRGGQPAKMSKGNADRGKSALSSLPDTSRIREIYSSEPRTAAAVAVLYSIDAHLEMDDIMTQISDCIGDFKNESMDPFYQSFHVNSIIYSMNILWKSIQDSDDSMKEELLNQAVSQMVEWSTVYGEYAYVFMAAFVLSVDDTALCWTGTTTIQTTIIDGQYNHVFESEDTKCLCLGLVAARLSRNSDARVSGLIDPLERCLLNGRQTSFGAYFGLGMIVSNLITGDMNGTDPSITWRKQQAQRIVCTLLSSFNSCLTHENEYVSSLTLALKSGGEANNLLQSCSTLDDLNIGDGFTQKMRACLMGLGSSFPMLSFMSGDLLKCVISAIDKLHWGSGKGNVLSAAYSAAIDAGVIERKDLLGTVEETSNFVQKSEPGVGDALLYLASMCHLLSDQANAAVVLDRCQGIIQGRFPDVSGDDRLLTIIAGCGSIGELPGLAFSTPRNYAKTSSVAKLVKVLDEVAMSDSEEPKYKDASTIGLGLLCAMSNTSGHVPTKVRVNNLESIQAKDGSFMQDILIQVEKAYTLLCTSSPTGSTQRGAIAIKLCALCSTLETVALPGGFSRVIEQILNVSSNFDVELKASSMKLLVSQVESRRRIGFDGRGFIDLTTRFAKAKDLNVRIGSATAIVMMCLPDLIPQIPTSVGEEVVTSLWTTCRNDLKVSSSSESMAEFFVGMKKMFALIGDNNFGDSGNTVSKKFISPALQRTLQNFINVEVFDNLCDDTALLNHSGNCSENVWSAYLACLQVIPGAATSESGVFNGNITQSNVFGLAIRSTGSTKAIQKVEYWISLQDRKNVSSADLRVLLLSIVTVATHRRKEMKESILALFEVMLVKGIDTMSLYLLAAKVAFWWNSTEFHQFEFVDLTTQRVSAMSSFYMSGKLNFDTITPSLLFRLFDAFIADLPAKLAVICGILKISEDASNRASRIIDATYCEERTASHISAISCLRSFIQLADGGEI